MLRGQSTSLPIAGTQPQSWAFARLSSLVSNLTVHESRTRHYVLSMSPTASQLLTTPTLPLRANRRGPPSPEPDRQLRQACPPPHPPSSVFFFLNNPPPPEIPPLPLHAALPI